MQIGVIGAGRIGGNAARLLAAAGHEVLLSFARDEGKLADAGVLEAPRRPGAVYGEEYHLDDALAVQTAVRKGEPIPPVPSY